MLNRRRFLSIAASCAVAGSLPASLAFAVPATSPSVWKGVAMGALASMTLVHPDRAHAQAMIARCVAEVERLEAVFSLYRPDSALSRLNATGVLDSPPSELVELLSFSLSLAQASHGAFDPTVQPRSAAITLNGVAQGFVTDRVADLLLANGFGNVLIDLGEGRALGHRPDGGAWRAAVANPAEPSRTLFDLELGSERGQSPALATSGGYGTRFGPDPLLHHLLDPRTGRSANHYASVSVAAARATLADGLSTTLSIVPPTHRDPLLARYPSARAWFVDSAGHVIAPDDAQTARA